ncbi:MAG: rhomboid family intramembrane serine protease [Candidatus Cloacimonetes bacterium]|nr:rhomboid family intramembrane serine protease [Candidatus Cloacimonadota bacterium]
MKQQKQIEILQNISLNKELLSYSEIYKIEDVNESCFIVYLYCSSLITSQHIFVISENKESLQQADFYIRKHLSLQKGIKSLSLYLCLPGGEHKLVLSEDKKQKQYSILFPFDFADLRSQMFETNVKAFPVEKMTISYILVGLILLIYFLNYLSIQFTIFEPWFIDIGISVSHYLANDYYNMFMALLSHAGLTHLGFNVLSLIYIGRILERHFSSSKYLAIVAVSGSCGALGSIAFIPDQSTSVGASGFIMGLIGSLLTITFLKNSHWPSYYQEQYHKLRSSLLALLAINLAIPFFVANIDSAAHICGFIGGVFLALLFNKSRTYKSKLVLCVLFSVYVFCLEFLIETKIMRIEEFRTIQQELISSLNTKEYMMKRNIVEISKLNKGIKFEFNEGNKVNYPINPKIASKDPLLERLNKQLTSRLKSALSQLNSEQSLKLWKSEYDKIELEILVKYKLIKANATRDTK